MSGIWKKMKNYALWQQQSQNGASYALYQYRALIGICNWQIKQDLVYC